MSTSTPVVRAIDLFCGAGGLSYGLKQAGIEVVGGFDIDPRCAYPFEANIKAPFFQGDIRDVKGKQLSRLWKGASVTLLAGCAPCQPFSSHRRGADTTADVSWPLLDEFSRLVKEASPHVVTMENVPRIMSTDVFSRFVDDLESTGYEVNYKSCYGPDYGLPQHRRRLVLIGSRIGSIEVPKGQKNGNYRTVRQVIGKLPPVEAGDADSKDRLHKARTLTDINLKRMIASTPGGTWRDWPEELRSACHRRASGASFANVYARMVWDEPSPTITTQSYNFGTGRFGHPEQNRSITLREAAMLQGFPQSYRFVRPREKVEFASLGRLIGNAVPPILGKTVGATVLRTVRD